MLRQWPHSDLLGPLDRPAGRPWCQGEGPRTSSVVDYLSRAEDLALSNPDGAQMAESVAGVLLSDVWVHRPAQVQGRDAGARPGVAPEVQHRIRMRIQIRIRIRM